MSFDNSYNSDKYNKKSTKSTDSSVSLSMEIISSLNKEVKERSKCDKIKNKSNFINNEEIISNIKLDGKLGSIDSNSIYDDNIRSRLNGASIFDHNVWKIEKENITRNWIISVKRQRIMNDQVVITKPFDNNINNSFNKAKPTIILVHGFACNKTFWRIKNSSFTGYMVYNGFQVIGIDLPDHQIGESVDFLYKFITKYRNILFKEIILIGHSLGGLVCNILSGKLIENKMQDILKAVSCIASPHSELYHSTESKVYYYSSQILYPLATKMQWVKKIRLPINILAQVTKNVPCMIHRVNPIEIYKCGSIEYDVLARVLNLSVVSVNMSPLYDMFQVKGDFRRYLKLFESSDTNIFFVVSKGDKIVDYRDSLLGYEKKKLNRKKLVLEENEFGHIDLVVGKKAIYHVWSPIREWINSIL